MRKIIAVFIVSVMIFGMLTGCEEKKEVCFGDYTKNFGKDLQTVEKYYANVGKLEALDGWLGVIWYRLSDKELLGFTVDENGESLAAAYVPIWSIYPEIYDKDTLSKSEFEEYIGKETELVPLFDESEVTSPFLTYYHDNLKVTVFCDDEGNVKCGGTEYSDCMFVEKQ